MKHKIGNFKQFKEMTLAIVRGEHKPSPNEPRIWVESNGKKLPKGAVHFRSLEAGAKLLSSKNLELLRLIAKRHPKSVKSLAAMTGRAEPNLLRTLHKLKSAGVVRFDQGDGKAYKPVVTASKVHFEIDLLEAN